MSKLLQYIYTFYCAVLLISIFLILFPFVFVCLQFEQTKPLAHRLNFLWGRLFFPLAGMPVSIQYEEKPNINQAYVFVGNHFSYLDVALIQYLLRNYFAFVGKSSVKKIPLLGYMFRKLHIQVERTEKDSRVKALHRSIRALKNKRSIMIFPEGGIYATTFPTMHQPWQDGAFIMAIENKVPIIPISILDCYKALPATLLQGPRRLHVVFHKAIDTNNLTKEDIEPLKKQVFDTIQTTLNLSQF